MKSLLSRFGLLGLIFLQQCDSTRAQGFGSNTRQVQNIPLTSTVPVSCTEVLLTSNFQGSCCSLGAPVPASVARSVPSEEEACQLTVQNGQCTASGPYFNLDWTSTYTNANETGASGGSVECPSSVYGIESPGPAGILVLEDFEDGSYIGSITEKRDGLFLVEFGDGSVNAYSDTGDIRALVRNYEEWQHPTSSVVWQGRYQYFTATNTFFRYPELGKILRFGPNDTSRKFPPCSECFTDEVRVPWNTEARDFAMSLIGFPGGRNTVGNDVFVDSSGVLSSFGLLNINLIEILENGSATRTVLGYPNTTQTQNMAMPSGADGWSCDFVAFDFVSNLNEPPVAEWVAENVVLANGLQEGYCPTNIYRPCLETETCILRNQNLTCIPGRDPDTAPEIQLLQDFDCPSPPEKFVPTKDEVLVSWEETKLSESGGIRFDQRRTYLQASNYSFVIGDDPNNVTVVRFPPLPFPDGFDEVSRTEYEIFNIWRDQDRNDLERRINFQFSKAEFGAYVTSLDGWRLDLSWVYDNLPDWTEWNADAPIPGTIDISVPQGYSLWACEMVEFRYQSTYEGGSAANWTMEQVLLGGFLDPGYNVCDGTLPIYHPCPDGEICHAINGEIECLQPETESPENDESLAVAARSSSTGGPRTDPSTWLECEPPRMPTEAPTSAPEEDDTSMAFNKSCWAPMGWSALSALVVLFF